jgi:cation transporter-like permease
MRRPAILLIALGLMAVAGFFAWAFWATRGDWTGGSRAILIAMIAGAVGVGALTGVLMWLAFYSSRAGYDENLRVAPPDPEPDERNPPDTSAD